MRVQLTKHGEEKKRLEGLVEAARNEVGKAEEETTRAKEDGTRLGKVGMIRLRWSGIWRSLIFCLI